MKRAILVASFGTTHTDALESCIRPLEQLAREKFSAFAVASAFTSGMVRAKLGRHGIEAHSPEEALEALESVGVDDIAILSTHLLAGFEYEKLQMAAERFRHLHIRIAKPLLSRDEDCEAVLDILRARYPHTGGDGLVLMGHGSEHPCNAVYARINSLIREKKLGQLFAATVEAEPGLNAAMEEMRAQGVRRVLLTPLLFVAGDHAKNDMAGGWLTAFRKAGFEAEAQVTGLGEYPEIREMLLDHLTKIIAASSSTETV